MDFWVYRNTSVFGLSYQESHEVISIACKRYEQNPVLYQSNLKLITNFLFNMKCNCNLTVRE